ncbi:MAG: lipopolysaccharide transport periplasmic protein LptA [Pseudomonadota bacterium]|jgi:lipopolysaccharide transport protein LptA
MRRFFLFLLTTLLVITVAPLEGAGTPTPPPAAQRQATKKPPPAKKTVKTQKKPAQKQPTKRPPPPAKPVIPAETPGGSSQPADLDALSKLHGTNSKEPTFIKSDSLTLKADERVFVYSGNVEVKQGAMTLTCAEIEGRYNEKNQIDTINARKDVVIVKEDIRGTAQKAFFDAASNSITLSENPEIHQNGSILSADSIKIFLNENRSVAEGTVRVKLMDKTSGGEPISLR